MPKFYKYTTRDLIELQKEGCNCESINRFRDKHYYYTCTNCHKEELYTESPVVKDNIWNKIIGKLGIRDNAEIPHAKMYNVPKEKEYAEAVRFYRLFKTINEVEPDESYVMLCRQCMETGLGRELYAEDLEDCGMTKNIIGRFKSKTLSLS